MRHKGFIVALGLALGMSFLVPVVSADPATAAFSPTQVAKLPVAPTPAAVAETPKAAPTPKRF